MQVLTTAPHFACRWSLGVVFCEMHLGGSPIPQVKAPGRSAASSQEQHGASSVTVDELQELFRRGRHLDALPVDLDEHARQCIAGLLSPNPSERIASLDLLKAQPLYTSFDWLALFEMRVPSPLYSDADPVEELFAPS